MNCWIKYLVVAALIFLITYNPASGNLVEKFMETSTESPACCIGDNVSNDTCTTSHYQNVQLMGNKQCELERNVVSDGAKI